MLIFWGGYIYTEVGLQDHMVDLFLNSKIFIHLHIHAFTFQTSKYNFTFFIHVTIIFLQNVYFSVLIIIVIESYLANMDTMKQSSLKGKQYLLFQINGSIVRKMTLNSGRSWALHF
jgi:hypothetical protein